MPLKYNVFENIMDNEALALLKQMLDFFHNILFKTEVKSVLIFFNVV